MGELAFVDSLGHFAQGFVAVFEPWTFFNLCLGLFVGFWVGILPGVGGPTTLALLIPFTFTMNPFAAFALLLGMISVTSTAGDITAILFGVPGESTNAAIMTDGLPMAKNGEAGRALGAALVSSLMGAIIGAFFLAIGIVLVRPLVLSVGYAEFFMLSLGGITFLASLSARAVFKGLAAGALGLLLSVVGLSQVTGIERYTFGSLFLWDGIGFIPAILGLFAIPELIDMASGQARLTAPPGKRISNSWQGAKDAVQHLGLVFRCSALATYIGLIPGMGASIAQWVAYGHAAQTAKDRDKMGHGAIEGIIGPGAACTATMSGSLVPTIGFGVPGSPQMAILLGAFIVQGLVPGPSMLISEAQGGHLTLTFSMVWMIIIANVIVVAASFMFLNQMARVAYLDEGILIPFILTLLFIGAFANKNDLNDLWVCFGFGLLGWAMERLQWPRPPLILGLVLGELIESNLFLTMQAYGFSWLKFPSVIIIFVAIVISVAWPFLAPLRSRLRGRRQVATAMVDVDDGGLQQMEPTTEQAPRPVPFPTGDLALCLLLLLVFALAVVGSIGWPYSANLMPLMVSIAGIIFASVQLWIVTSSAHRTGWLRGVTVSLAVSTLVPAAKIWGAYLAYLCLVYLLGMVYATGVFLLVWLLGWSQLRRVYAIALALSGTAVVYGLFQRVLTLPFPEGWLVEAISPWVKLSLH